MACRAGFALLTTALLAALFACGSESEPPPTAELRDAAPALEETARPRGLWVLCEGSQRVLEHPERLDQLIEFASALRATDLFVQVYRGGQAWFDSTRADAAPYQRMQRAQREQRTREASDAGDAGDAGDEDSLRALVRRAHERGMRVHAWVNVLSLAQNREARVIAELGRGAVLVDQRGRSILDYPQLDVPPPDRSYYRMGTPAVWLDPAAPGIAEHLTAIFAELISRYPELDGLHLDYIRYPDVLPFAPGSRFGVGLDFGHGEATRARFRSETGLDAPAGEALHSANRWDEWRREKMNELVGAIASAARSARPEGTSFAPPVVSAAVGAYAQRVYLSEAQDWKRWIDDGLLDFAVPMAYTLDDRMFRYMVEEFASDPRADRIWIGHGTWLFAARPAGALDQLAVARAAKSAGEVLFSYDSIAESAALRDALLASLGEPARER